MGVYSLGCKPFLTGLKVGAEVELPAGLKYHSIKAIASRIYRDYGCRFRFSSRDGKVIVKRIS